MKFYLTLLVILPFFMTAQSIELSSSYLLKLGDSTSVSLIQAKQCSHCYYYLPVNFRLATNNFNQLEGSLITWENEKGTEIDGGIMHLLFEWGLTTEQETDTQKLLKSSIDSLGVLLGAVTVEQSSDYPKIWFSGNRQIVDVLNSALVQEVSTATLPGAKMALAFRFETKAIKLLLEKIEANEFDALVNFELQLTEPYRYAKVHTQITFQNILAELSN